MSEFVGLLEELLPFIKLGAIIYIGMWAVGLGASIAIIGYIIYGLFTDFGW